MSDDIICANDNNDSSTERKKFKTECDMSRCP